MGKQMERKLEAGDGKREGQDRRRQDRRRKHYFPDAVTDSGMTSGAAEWSMALSS